MTEASPDLNDIYRAIRDLQKKSCQKCGKPVEGEGFLCDNCKDTISVRDWIQSPTIEPISRMKRKQLLQVYAKANAKGSTFTLIHLNGATSGRKGVSVEQVAEAVESLNEEVRKGKSLYGFSVRFIEYMKENHYTPYNIKILRRMIPGFFKSTLGPTFFSETVYNEKVKEPKDTSIRNLKEKPSTEKIREMLRLATPQQKALIGGYVISGMRPDELVSRKMKGLKLRSDGHAMIELQPEETKSRYYRQCYLTTEVVNWIRDYHTRLHGDFETCLKSDEWVFPGYKGQHLRAQVVWLIMKKFFKDVGLDDSREEASDGTFRRKVFTTHSLRTVSQTLLTDSGLKEQWVKWTIGHKTALGSDISYPDWEKCESAWVEVSKKLVFEKKVEIVIPESAEIKELKAFKEKYEPILKQLGVMLDYQKQTRLGPLASEQIKRLMKYKKLKDETEE